MHRFWLGLHILLVVCLVPGPSWANASKGTSKLAQKSDLTVENVWQHEVQKNRQRMKIKMLRDMGLEPMSVLADEISLKIQKIYENEEEKASQLPSEKARRAKKNLRHSKYKFVSIIGEMYTTMKRYKENKIDVEHARKKMKNLHDEIYNFSRSSYGSKVWALLQDETQKNYNRKQNIIFVRGELGADFKNEYKKAHQNPTKTEQILKPFKNILTISENTSDPTFDFLALAVYTLIALIVMGIAVVVLKIALLAHPTLSLFLGALVILALLGTPKYNRDLPILLKYNLFLETKKRADSKPIR